MNFSFQLRRSHLLEKSKGLKMNEAMANGQVTVQGMKKGRKSIIKWSSYSLLNWK